MCVCVCACVRVCVLCVCVCVCVCVQLAQHGDNFELTQLRWTRHARMVPCVFNSQECVRGGGGCLSVLALLLATDAVCLFEHARLHRKDP